MTKTKETKPIPTLIKEYVDVPYMTFVKDAMDHNDHLLLIGHCGVGKTSSVEQVASRENWPVKKINLNGQTTISDLIGQYIAKDGETVWIDGILPVCMKNGWVLILDEIDAAMPEVLFALHGVLDSDDAHLVLAEKDGETVYPKKGFRVVGTANTIGADAEERGLYQGTNHMNEAFMDRWSTVIRVGWPPKELEVKILMQRVPGLPTSVASLIVRVASECREAFDKGEVYCTFSPRKCLQWADKVLRYGNLMSSAETTILNKLGSDDREVVRGIIQRWVGSE